MPFEFRGHLTDLCIVRHFSHKMSGYLDTIQKEAYASKSRKADLRFRANTKISYLPAFVICYNPYKSGLCNNRRKNSADWLERVTKALFSNAG